MNPLTTLLIALIHLIRGKVNMFQYCSINYDYMNFSKIISLFTLITPLIGLMKLISDLWMVGVKWNLFKLFLNVTKTLLPPKIRILLAS